jgi:hypothetical protein
MDTIEKAMVDGKGVRTSLAMGGAAAALSALGALVDVGIGMSTGGSVSALPHDAVGRFAQLAADPLLGLYNLDLLNLVTTLVMVPALYACWLALRREGKAAGLALAFGLLGAAVFVANNSALPMLGLSLDYAKTDPARKSLLAAAGEALLAKGAHGSPGVLAGFLLSSVANLILSGAMLATKTFSRLTGILGACGNLLLGTYLILVTLLPQVQDRALALAAPGGLMAIAWIVLMSARLFRLSRTA